MSGVEARIERSAGDLVVDGLALEDIAASLPKGEARNRIKRIAEEVLDEAVEVEDVALDVASAKQTLTLGREKTPNRTLRDRDRRLEMLKELSAARCKTKAHEERELIEGRVTVAA
jgi:hypothetical protein